MNKPAHSKRTRFIWSIRLIPNDGWKCFRFNQISLASVECLNGKNSRRFGSSAQSRIENRNIPAGSAHIFGIGSQMPIFGNEFLPLGDFWEGIVSPRMGEKCGRNRRDKLGCAHSHLAHVSSARSDTAFFSFRSRPNGMASVDLWAQWK